MDATPIRLGQEFSGYASQVEHGIARVKAVLPDLRELALAAPRSDRLNTHPSSRAAWPAELSARGRSESRGSNHFEGRRRAPGRRRPGPAGAQHRCGSLVKIANDVRLMNSGPRCGLAEVALPAVQPGSASCRAR